ncbi:Gfo/Idh/MocA family protein [Gandjariella thermophila]|uniref:Oxidoreductase n=1 Tax=Gandjariella thermophila TaxID=1931992 RepID=A0A4D4JCZ6_9PSEU|nr:Gfo/Idh/MocA family oxidoreductase [Gandjariella thermophila]GDY32249.1 oxidoreductase [Gandjariella thermophila]
MSTTARDELRVGLLGYGLAGAVFHGPLIAATPGLRLTTVVTGNPERADRARRDHPGVVVLDHPDRLWERAADLDLVVVATPNRSHVPLTGAALAAGLPVVVDKPFAATAEQGRRLAAEARSRGLLLTVFQNRRWDGDFRTLRRVVAAGDLGRVLRLESRFERWVPTPRTGWRENGAPEDAGGVLYDLGSHLVDQALHLLGPATSVYAELNRRRPGVEVDDDAFVALTHAGGARSHLWMGSVSAHHGPRFRVLGDRAAYTKHGLDGQEAALQAGRRPGQPGWGEEPRECWGVLGVPGDTREVPGEPGAYQNFYAGVRDALVDGGSPPVDPDEAIAGLVVLEAARRSATEGAVVRL